MELLPHCHVLLLRYTWKRGDAVCKAWYCSEETCLTCMVTMDDILDQRETNK